MPTKVRIELNLAGINAVMKSSGVQEDLNDRAQRIAGTANAAMPDGEGFAWEQGRPHPWIARSYVWTDTYEAMVAEATDHVLTRAIDAGRD